jgi:hypothetical protein
MGKENFKIEIELIEVIILRHGHAIPLDAIISPHMCNYF